MKHGTRILPGLFLLAIGFGCLNYTKAFGVEHHYEWAQESGFPAPSGEIYFLGVGCMAVGGMLLGSGLSRRRSAAR